MDVYRKELEEFYARQRLRDDRTPEDAPTEVVARVHSLVEITGMCAVVTDIIHDRSLFVGGGAAALLHLSEQEAASRPLDSSDEDFLYLRMHPEDLVDLRMLEYEFFRQMEGLAPGQTDAWTALAEVRMADGCGGYVTVTKSTRVLARSPRGAVWLALCGYEAPRQNTSTPDARMVNIRTGETRRFTFTRAAILTAREREVLQLIRSGLLSKEIASRMGITVNTVNRHRQNILEKLSVDNSMEAVNAACAMRLI